MSKPEVCPEDNHLILTPDGRQIRIPNVIQTLKQLGLLERDRDTGLYRLRSIVYEFLDSDYETLMSFGKVSLRRLLGRDLTGPQYVDCQCKECLTVEEDADYTPISGRVARFIERDRIEKDRQAITVNGIPLDKARRRPRLERRQLSRRG